MVLMHDASHFDDLLDYYSDDVEEDDEAKGTPMPHQIQSVSDDPAKGPLKWNVHSSIELQKVVDSYTSELNAENLNELEFSVTMADPSQPDCPLVACSIGFTDLTGYQVHEIVGRNCRFLLNQVPGNLIDEETRHRCRSFCKSVSNGQQYDGCSEVLPSGVKKCWLSLPKGELICIQTNARKSGELFRNMFYIREVELDDVPYILGLQAGIPDEYEDNEEGMEKLQMQCYNAWAYLDKNMNSVDKVLAAHFWYQAPMRRQCNYSGMSPDPDDKEGDI